MLRVLYRLSAVLMAAGLSNEMMPHCGHCVILLLDSRPAIFFLHLYLSSRLPWDIPEQLFSRNPAGLLLLLLLKKENDRYL